MYMCALILCTHLDYEAKLAASKEEQQQLLEQCQRMGHARDIQISQLQNENKLLQDKCKQLIKYSYTKLMLFVVDIALVNNNTVAT